MIKISYNNKEYTINKDKLVYVLSKLKNEKVDDTEIFELMEKYSLYDEYFLENVNKL